MSAWSAAWLAGWLALDVTRSRRVALVRGGMAILGHLLRIALSVVLIAGSAVADGAIAATMLRCSSGWAF
jgi:hypothetical protein